jgi:hypothetical protein
MFFRLIMMKIHLSIGYSQLIVLTFINTSNNSLLMLPSKIGLMIRLVLKTRSNPVFMSKHLFKRT